jgi:protein-S-isoprenylcysteine O-methyltransferase Ste14
MQWVLSLCHILIFYSFVWHKRRTLTGGPFLTWPDKITVVLPLLMLPTPSQKVNVAGIAIQSLGWAVCLAGLWQLQHGKIATSGMYRVVRHPMYTGYLLWLGGWVLNTGGVVWWFNALVWVWLCWGLIQRLNREETWLLQQTDTYKAYRQKTPFRLLPWVF